MMWIQYLSVFDNITIPSFNDSHQDPLNMLPEIQIPQYVDVQEFVDDEQTARTSLKRVIQKAKDNQPLYLNKLHQISTETRYWLLKNHHAIPLSLAGLVWLALLSVALYCVARKHFILSAFVNHSMIPGAKSCSIGSDTDHTWGTMDYCLLYLIGAVTLLWILKILVCAYKFWKHRKQSQDHYPPSEKFVVFTKVYLKLTSGAKQVVLHMDRLYMPQHKLVFVRPDNRLPAVRPISSFKGLKLVITWKDITIQQRDTGMKIPMLNCLQVPANARDLTLVILRQETYTLSLIVTTGPEQREFEPMLLTGQKYRPPDPTKPGPPPVPKKRKRSSPHILWGMATRPKQPRQVDQPQPLPGSRRYRRRREARTSDSSGYMPFVRHNQTSAQMRSIRPQPHVLYASPAPQPRPRRFSYHEVIEDIGEPVSTDRSIRLDPAESTQSLPQPLDLAPPTHPDDLLFETTSEETGLEESSGLEMDRLD
jgi:hypothetical protein